MFETIHTVTSRDRHSVPWSNRRGVTSEIARGAPAASGAPSWRLSVAALREDAEFSPLRGIARVFTVIGKTGVTLQFADHHRPVAPLDPCAFAGEDGPFCEVTTPTEVFNVMVERTAADAAVASVVVTTRATIYGRPGSIVAVFVAAGSGRLDGARITSGDCLICRGGHGAFRGSARLLIVEIVATKEHWNIEPLGRR